MEGERIFPLVKRIFTNILQGEKYGVIQTDSPISRDFLILTIQLNCSDRIFPKNSMWKVALVSQNVQNLEKKITEGNARKFTVNFTFFGYSYADVIKCQKNLRFRVSARRSLQLTSPARVRP